MSSSKSYPVITTFDKARQVLVAKWNIKAYKKITDKSLSSEIFSHPSAPSEWRMTVHPNGNSEKSVNNLSFYLYGGCKDFDTTAMFSLGYEDKSGREALRDTTRMKHTFKKPIFGFGYATFFMTDWVNTNLVKADGSLTLYVEIDYETLKWGPRKQFSRFKLGNDLGFALDGKYTDVVFKVGKLSIKAHKVIIAYRSKYFQAMFDNDSSEARSGVVTITDFEFGVVRGLLEFIYQGGIELSNVGFASSLRIAADKYEVLDLGDICEDYIIANLNKKNAASVILSTTLVESKAIREACLEVFKKRANFKDIDNFADVWKDSALAEYVSDSFMNSSTA